MNGVFYRVEVTSHESARLAAGLADPNLSASEAPRRCPMGKANSNIALRYVIHPTRLSIEPNCWFADSNNCIRKARLGRFVHEHLLDQLPKWETARRGARLTLPGVRERCASRLAMSETSLPKSQLDATRADQSLWTHPDFLKLWTAQTISAFGDQFTALAIPLIAVLTLKATPVQMGILTAAERAPFLLLSLFAGVWVDRLPRRPILIIGDFGRALILLTIPLAAVLHSLSILQLYLVALFVGILSVFFDISWQAILPVLVSRKQIVEGNSKLEATRALASLAGPSLAGIAIQYVSAPAVIILDALSFFSSGGFIGRIERREPPKDRSSRSPLFAEIREGLSVVWTNPILRSVAMCSATWNFFGTAQLTLYILFATRVLLLGPAKIGLILGFGNFAALAGAIGSGWAARRLGIGPAIVGSAFVGGFATIPIALATPRTAVPLLVLAGLLGNFTALIYNINQVSLRQTITPHRLQGRMNATMKFLILGTMPLGGLLGGVLGDAVGLRPAFAITAIGALLPFLWVFCSPLRRLDQIPAAVD